jgi:hypothetical protein
MTDQALGHARRIGIVLVGALLSFACHSHSGASGDAGTANDGGSPDGGGQPIQAPADQWTWVDFPDSKCASGTPTGIGVNPHAGATNVLFYFEGGGSCSTGDSCWGPMPGAANVAGYDSTTFATAMQRKYPILNRNRAGNPFAELNMVYVPYCTGDLHAGSVERDLAVNGATRPTYFWGALDLDLFLSRVVPTFPQAQHVWISGTSAGGFGSFLVFDHVARAFGARVDILDDSGPAIAPKGTTENRLLGVWGFVPPSGCSSCTSYADVLAFDRRSQPMSRYGFLSFAEDTVISKDMGYTLTEFSAVIDAYSSSLASDPNAKTYVVTNEQSHVVESDLTLAPEYLPWVTQMVNDDPTWADATYAHP